MTSDKPYLDLPSVNLITQESTQTIGFAFIYIWDKQKRIDNQVTTNFNAAEIFLKLEITQDAFVSTYGFSLAAWIQEVISESHVECCTDQSIITRIINYRLVIQYYGSLVMSIILAVME